MLKVYNSLNISPIFHPKPLLESLEHQLQPCIIIVELVRAPALLLGIIRYVYFLTLFLVWYGFQQHTEKELNAWY